MNTYKRISLFIFLIIFPLILGIIYDKARVLIGLFILSVIIVWFIIINANKFVLLLYKARPALSGDLPEIQEKIRTLSARYGVTVPSIYITEVELPGSFIIGRDMHRTIIVVPKRLSTLLKSDEVEAVLAHNIVQIDNNIRKRTIVALITAIMTMPSLAIRWGAAFTGFGDYNDPAPKLFGLFIMGLTAPPAAALIQSLSKEDYDTKAITLSKNSDALICAIKRLESNNVTGYSSLGFLCLIDPQKETFFEYLFNVHSSQKIRAQKLRRK
ncbi:MAG: small heat shock protein [Candidatus Methanoperedens nitroreducens]|uniref:Small heat shock protein n=1 Tax=Candidatus Methanoperedens nitratireducens TaxID=1392998 RepID=A0A0P8CMQ6_9EURY|nr:MAG: M48 family metalloprotease [Candidatus Methanoperedens sp.]KPQ44800.1 MAG: small heat shock protein [Candidatus Methanoperedens sp. BLZ1]MBZ0177222.1 M48 family metalloprotease [Candidatus Methanoperedens nitroreducens]MCX9089284.1 M48 family metalloprotease [Candidatus Methanoperedens sp.]CAG0957151.1 Protease HtpX [Methanosarcinales archaeon]